MFTYDLTDPEDPERLDFLLVNQGQSGTGAALAQEDPSTDGRVVLVDGINDAGERGMQIVSVEDPTNLARSSAPTAEPTTPGPA